MTENKTLERTAFHFLPKRISRADFFFHFIWVNLILSAFAPHFCPLISFHSFYDFHSLFHNSSLRCSNPIWFGLFSLFTFFFARSRNKIPLNMICLKIHLINIINFNVEFINNYGFLLILPLRKKNHLVERIS